MKRLVLALVVALGLCVPGSAAELPPSVRLTIHSYTEGLVEVQCWMESAQYVPLPSGGQALYVECRTSVDGIFKNGFDPQSAPHGPSVGLGCPDVPEPDVRHLVILFGSHRRPLHANRSRMGDGVGGQGVSIVAGPVMYWFG